MKLENILAVSGLPGLYRLVNNRNNGLLVSDLDGDKTRFCSVRKHQFTPLETVAIYTYQDSTELSTIIQAIDQHSDQLPDVKTSSSTDIQGFFRQILPDYDEDRVYVSDMKKVLKWYGILKERGMIDAATDEEE